MMMLATATAMVATTMMVMMATTMMMVTTLMTVQLAPLTSQRWSLTFLPNLGRAPSRRHSRIFSPLRDIRASLGGVLLCALLRADNPDELMAPNMVHGHIAACRPREPDPVTPPTGRTPRLGRVASRHRMCTT